MILSKIWNNKNRLWLVKENKKYIMIYKKDKIKLRLNSIKKDKVKLIIFKTKKWIDNHNLINKRIDFQYFNNKII